jgi:hypothetical protein
VQSWDYGAQTPYTLQWNFDVQRSFFRDLLVDVAYSGSRGVHLARGYNYDALPTQLLSLGTGLQQLVDNPFYGKINVGTLSQSRVQQRQLLLPYPQFNGVSIINSSSAMSSYHSLQVKAEKRMGKGQSVLFSFTAGKLMSDANNFLAGLGVQNNNTGVQDWYNLKGERSISEMDVSRSMVLSYVAELPFGPGKKWANANKALGRVVGGWQSSIVFNKRGGMPLPFNATIPGGGNRPNSAGRSAAIEADRTRGEKIAQWFDTSAFTQPNSFTMGNVVRVLSDVRGPGVTSLDLSLVKSIRIGERVDLRLRGEAFNLFNTPQFWQPNTAFGSLQFGQITQSQQTVLPRVMQIALKLAF